MITVPLKIFIETVTGTQLHQIVIDVPVPNAPTPTLGELLTEELLEELRRRITPPDGDLR